MSIDDSVNTTDYRESLSDTVSDQWKPMQGSFIQTVPVLTIKTTAYRETIPALSGSFAIFKLLVEQKRRMIGQLNVYNTSGTLDREFNTEVDPDILLLNNSSAPEIDAFEVREFFILEELKRHFISPNWIDVIDFLSRHAFLVNTLRQVVPNVRDVFEDHCQKLRLQRFVDTEEGIDNLIIIVDTDIPPRRAVDLLYEFNRAYWFHVDPKIIDLITVTVH